MDPGSGVVEGGCCYCDAAAAAGVGDFAADLDYQAGGIGSLG
jgi:hypothetical protein